MKSRDAARKTTSRSIDFVVEVVRVEGGEREDGGALQGGARPLLDLDTQLLPHELVEQRGGRLVASDGLLRGRTEEIAGVVEPERAEDLLERERGEVTRDRGLGPRGLL